MMQTACVHKTGSCQGVRTPWVKVAAQGAQNLFHLRITPFMVFKDWWIILKEPNVRHVIDWSEMLRCPLHRVDASYSETKQNRDIWRYCKTIQREWRDLYRPKLRVFHSGAIGFLGVKLRSLSVQLVYDQAWLALAPDRALLSNKSLVGGAWDAITQNPHLWPCWSIWCHRCEVLVLWRRWRCQTDQWPCKVPAVGLELWHALAMHWKAHVYHVTMFQWD